MEGKPFSKKTTKEKCSFYQQKITQHSPPASEHDLFLIEFCRTLLQLHDENISSDGED
jgi:hypothetical protein